MNIDRVLEDRQDQGMEDQLEVISTQTVWQDGPIPLEMLLTDAEIQRAQTIKQAVQVNPDIDNLSDFEYVQYALASEPEESLEFIVQKRIFTIQCFKQEYKVEETLEEGVTSFHHFTLAYPGFVLALEKYLTTGGYVCIQDWSKLFPARIDTPNKMRDFMVATYYHYHAWNPDFRAMRQGIRNMTECEGTSFANYDQAFFENSMEQLYVCYPKRHLVHHLLHTPSVINIVYGLCKRFLTPHIRDSIQVGQEVKGFEGHRIDELFTIPTPELARQKLVRNIEISLRLRQLNQRCFSLPPP